MLTEQEAKKKWCPFARTAGGMNRYDMLGGESPSIRCRCIASNCMAWRWLNTPIKDEKKVLESAATIVLTERVYGYCGLAGKGYS